MSTLEQQLEQLEGLAKACHADADPEKIQTMTVTGFPIDAELNSRLQQMTALTNDLHQNPELDFRRSPRGFYLTVFPLLAQALIRIFEDNAPESLPVQARRGHITRRLFGLPDHLDEIATGATSWKEVSAQLAGYVDGTIAASLSEQGEPELAGFYQDHPDHFLALYRAGYSEFTGYSAPE